MSVATEIRGIDLVGRWQFDAMNTQMAVFTYPWRGSEPLQRIERAFREMEDRFSRFRPESELSRLNDRTGTPTKVSPELFHILERCSHYHTLTGSLFDPAILTTLESAGYDRSFEQVPQTAPAEPTFSPAAGSFADVALDRAASSIRVPAGLRVDLGGIGKGYTVDLVARDLAGQGSFLIDAGGDIFASGPGEDGRGWLVAVGKPSNPEQQIATVWLRDQALATSAVVRRRWRRGERWMHHLINPLTGAPVENNVEAVSVIAGTATDADVFAKTALLAGPEEGARFLEAHGATGLFALNDGTHFTTTGWPGGIA